METTKVYIGILGMDQHELGAIAVCRILRDAGVAVIGGFHSPIEKDCLDLLLRGTQPVIICPARNIENMRIGKEYRESLDLLEELGLVEGWRQEL